MNIFFKASAMLVLAGGLLAAGPVALGQDPQVQAEVSKALDKKQFRDVKADVQGGMVRLTGTVATYQDKEDADKRVHHAKNVTGVDNRIEVAGGNVDDATLRAKLGQKLQFDREGYGTLAFNSFTLGVQNGVVTVGGVAYSPEDKASALAVVSNYAGVRDVVDNIEVAPLSGNDDRIRLAAARAIYGAPTFTKYAIDPGKPIRITVINGNMTLTGVVDTQSDKDIATLRANSVPGAFKVTNLLQVAGSGGSK